MDITSEGLGDMFEGDSADMCGKKFLLDFLVSKQEISSMEVKEDVGGWWGSQLYISYSWVKIRLYTEIQLPRLPSSTLFGCGCDPDCNPDCDCYGVKTKSTPSLLTNDLVGV